MERTFGENLRRIRLVKGLTQEDLQARMGYARQSGISQTETKGVLPEPETIRRFARALQCDTSELMVGVVTDYDRLRDNIPLAHASRKHPAAKGRRVGSR